MSFSRAVAKDKTFWILIVFPVVIMLNWGLVIIPLVLLLLFLFVWPYLEDFVDVLRVIKNLLFSLSSKKKVVENSNESLKEFASDFVISIIGGVVGFALTLALLLMLMPIGMEFGFKNFNEPLLSYLVIYYLLVLSFEMNKHYDEFKKVRDTKNKTISRN